MTRRNLQSWRVIDHTADIGLEIEASDLQGLFECAADALFAQIADRIRSGPDRREQIQATGIDWPDLMYNWLRELFYLWAGQQRIVTGVRLLHVSPYTLEAEVHSLAYDPSSHGIGEEIKAVTYHQLRVEKNDSVWKARFFLDV